MIKIISQDGWEEYNTELETIEETKSYLKDWGFNEEAINMIIEQQYFDCEFGLFEIKVID